VYTRHNKQRRRGQGRRASENQPISIVQRHVLSRRLGHRFQQETCATFGVLVSHRLRTKRETNERPAEGQNVVVDRQLGAWQGTSSVVVVVMQERNSADSVRNYVAETGLKAPHLRPCDARTSKHAAYVATKIERGGQTEKTHSPAHTRPPCWLMTGIGLFRVPTASVHVLCTQIVPRHNLKARQKSHNWVSMQGG